MKIVAKVVYYSEFLSEYAKKSRGRKKSEVRNIGSLMIVPLKIQNTR